VQQWGISANTVSWKKKKLCEVTIFNKLERGPLKTSACQLTAAVKITYCQTLADLLN